jgi:signal transduction histidine kinase
MIGRPVISPRPRGQVAPCSKSEPARSRSRRVSVRLDCSRDRIEVVVADNGRGFDVDETLVRAGRTGRLGLIGMSERIRLLGGHFHIATNPESSTTVSASLPRWLPAAATS